MSVMRHVVYETDIDDSCIVAHRVPQEDCCIGRAGFDVRLAYDPLWFTAIAYDHLRETLGLYD